MRFPAPPHRFPFATIAAGIALVLLVTWLGSGLLHLNATTAGFAYLIVVLATATAWGLVQAIVVSLVAMLCFNFYFLPPVGRLTIADPQNWVALFAFLATALVASHLSNRARRQTAEASERQRETEQLYAFSRSILLSESASPVGAQLARQIARTFDCAAVAVYDAVSGEIFKGGAADFTEIEPKLKQIAVDGAEQSDKAAGLILAPITLGGHPIGSLALKGISASDGALQALANLLAIALERARSVEITSKAEAARQSEEFKSTLLDAIAHEFKTPLTSIKAASTSMLSTPDALSPPLRELAQIINEETNRLSLLVTEAVRMSEIEAGKLRLERRPTFVQPLLENALDHFQSRLEDRQVNVDAPAELPLVHVDPDLMGLALRQLIDNALKHSPAGLPIQLRAAETGGTVEIRVIDHGPGIPIKERERIFDRYYRRDVSRGRVVGSGLGLHIAREVVRAHGGNLWVEGAPDGGSEFCLTLQPGTTAGKANLS